MILVSVIIPTYNASLLIRRALESVLLQGAFEMELIVVDDCSTDDTVHIVEEMKISNLRIFRQDRNLGPAAARNKGLQEAKGRYCAFLDGDDYWEPDFLAETIGFMELHSECVAASVMQCHKIIGKEPIIVPLGTNVGTSIILNDFFDFWGRFNHVCTGSVLFKTEVALQIGGQREDLRICEDLEFWAMLALHGKWGFIPKVLFTSDGGAVTRSQGWLEKNKIRWNNAPSFANWKMRIDCKASQWKSTAMESALGRIARTLCYCHIMSHKDIMARQEVQDYGKIFPRTRINTLFSFMASTWLSWKIWCVILRFREYNRHC